MRIRTAVAVLALASAACSTPPPQADETESTPQTPLEAIDRARDVADSAEQRYEDLEAQLAELTDPFGAP